MYCSYSRFDIAAAITGRNGKKPETHHIERSVSVSIWPYFNVITMMKHPTSIMKSDMIRQDMIWHGMALKAMQSTAWLTIIS